jgi:hypothetical protein
VAPSLNGKWARRALAADCVLRIGTASNLDKDFAKRVLFCPNIMHVKLTDHILTSQMYFFFKYDKSAKIDYPTKPFSKLSFSSSRFSSYPALTRSSHSPSLLRYAP